jgi:F-type H+-transporting ATPase subunit delta
MADDRTLAYAEALFGVARAEGSLSEVEDELFRFSRTLQGSDELRDALTDQSIPVARRQQIVEDLLGGKASSTTVALVSLVVGTGRAKDLPAIISELVEMSAAEANKAVAEVRSAVPLTDDQTERLAKALGEATGRQVTVKLIVDPAVLGGIVAQVGDTVIDGSIRTRLERLRKAF